MDKLHGVEALSVVSKRFSDSCDVVRCILDFYNEMAATERRYSASINKLLESASYTFHSNVLTQWLGNDPYEEIGTLKCSWQKLGVELKELARLHSEKADNFAGEVRQPLLEVLPQMEEEKRKLRLKKVELETQMRETQRRYERAKKRYHGVGDTYEQLQADRVKLEAAAVNGGHLPKTQLARVEKKLVETKKEFEEEEDNYATAHSRHIYVDQEVNNELAKLFSEIQERELLRIEKVAKSLQEFARTLSNTAPVYLASMQRIVLSVDDIDGPSDIDSFVNEHPNLHHAPIPPPFELHKCSLAKKSASPAPENEVVTAVRTNAVTGQLEIRDNEEPQEENGPVENDQEEKEEDENNNSTEETEVVVVKDKPPRSNSHPEHRPPVTSRPVSDTTSSSAPVHKPKEATVLPSSLPTATLSPAAAASTRKPKLSAKPTLKTQDNEKEGRRERGVGAEKSNTAKPLTRGEKANQQTASRAAAIPQPTDVVKTNQPTASRTAAVPQPTGDGVSVKASHQPTASRTAAIPLPSVSSLCEKAHQPTVSTGAPPVLDGASGRANQLLRKLHRMVKANDYYSLLGVDPSAEQDELARARREITSRLHPDHFVANPKQQARAQEQLVIVNQAYSDVLRNESTRHLYDQLCKFRLKYQKIVQQHEVKALETARDRLSSLHQSMKKARLPLHLLEELDVAIQLVNLRIDEQNESQ